MTKLPIIKKDQELDFNDEGVQKVLYSMVAPKGTTMAEFYVFCQICSQTGLNPLFGEVYLIPTKNGMKTFCGVPGFRKIANLHPQYDGMEVDTTYGENGIPIKCVAKCYRKDRKFPAIGVAIFNEVKQNAPIWTARPTQMIEKCAEAIAIRRAFSNHCQGLYSEDEMPTNTIASSISKEETDLFTNFYDLSKNKHKAKDYKKILKEHAAVEKTKNIWICDHRIIPLDDIQVEEKIAMEKINKETFVKEQDFDEKLNAMALEPEDNLENLYINIGVKDDETTKKD